MPAANQNSRKLNVKSGLRLLKPFAYAGATVFAALGLVMLAGASDDVPPLRQPDVLFGVSTRVVLLVAGLLHLAIGGGLFATRDPMKQGLVACWAGLNYIVYLAGMAWLKAATPIPALVVVAWELGVSVKLAHLVWGLFIAYLVVGGLWLVILEWRHLKQLETEAYLKHWQEVREKGESQPVTPGRP